jgi:KaiC/GvpD/RAD55 family RecA-like ATPase
MLYNFKIPGLGRILGQDPKATDGEFRIPDDEQLFALIEGTSGVGKSLLALQMACEIVSRLPSVGEKSFVLYLTGEESPSTIAKRVADFDFLDEDQITILDNLTGFDTKLLDDWTGARLVIARCLALDFDVAARGLSHNSENQNGLEAITKLFREPKDIMDSIVTDSDASQEVPVDIDENRSTVAPVIRGMVMDGLGLYLNSLRDREYSTETGAPNREAYARRVLSYLKAVMDRNKLPFIATIESEGVEEKSGLSKQAEYVSNIVIKIAARKTPIEGITRRALQISKTRFQSCFRGEHDFSIIGRMEDSDLRRFKGPLFDSEIAYGIHINPSLACQLATLDSMAHGTPITPSDQRVFIGIDRLDFLVGRLGHAGFQHGTSIGVIAERGAGATTLAFHFIAEGIQKNEQCLFLSFSHSPQVIQSEASYIDRIGEILFPNGNPNRLFHIQYNVGASLSPERLLTRLDAYLREFRPKRVVLDDLSTLDDRYPAFEDIGLFAHAFVRLCLTHGAVPFLIDTVSLIDEKAVASTRMGRLQDLVDNVLVVANVNLRGQSKRAILIRKTTGGRSNLGPYELARIELQQDKTKIDVLTESFEAYTDVFSGFAKYIPLRLSMYVDQEPVALPNVSTDLSMSLAGVVHRPPKSSGNLAHASDRPMTPLARYKNQLAKTFSSNLPGIDVSYWGPDEHGTSSSGPRSWGEVPRPDTVVMEFDGYWISELEEDDRIIDLERQIRMMQMNSGTLGDSYLRGVSSPYRVPHYIDLGMLYRKIEDNADLKLSPPSWQEIATQVTDSDFTQWQQSAVFDFDRTTSEMLSVVFIEFALAALADSDFPIEQNRVSEFGVLATAQKVFRLKTENYAPLRLVPEIDSDLSKQYINAITKACATLLSLYPNTKQVRTYVASCKPCNINATYQRHWFSTFGAMTQSVNDNSRFAVHDKLPFITKHLDSGSSPVVGSWHLGVAKGSASPTLGVRAIVEMTSRESDMNRFANNVGLPAGKWFYDSTREDFFPLPVLRSPSPTMLRETYLNAGFSRAWIERYRDVSYVLQMLVKRLFRLDAVNSDTILTCCQSAQDMLNSIYKHNNQ